MGRSDSSAAGLAGKGGAIAAAALLAFSLNLLIARLTRPPEPAIHDEFSYLLAADTFASGRLTNETHPLWRHFESFHVLQVPTYQSKYPPGQGLALALGQALLGHPRFGLWLSMAAAAAALCWMLQGFMETRWALLGTLVFVLHPKFAAWWGQSYWGGAVAMAGGALVFGSLQRIVVSGTARRWAFVLGAGLFVLAITRPFEGLCATLPVAFVLAHAAWKAPERRGFVIRTVVPIALVLVPAFGWLGYYNFRVTGSAVVTPYALWNATYQADGADLRHIELERYHGSVDLSVGQELERLATFYGMPAFWLLVPALPFALRERRYQFALALFVTVCLISVSASKGWPHYTAPVSCLFFLLLARSLQTLGESTIVRGRLRWLVVVFALVHLHGFMDLFRQRAPAVWFNDWQYARSGIERELEAADGRDLIVVRYSAEHDVHREWVYNRADIDPSEVVWAREMTPQMNARMFEHFHDRNRWLFYADASPPRLVPYPDPSPVP